jgi:hypothetical protein
MFFLLFLLDVRRVRSGIHISDKWIRIWETKKHGSYGSGFGYRSGTLVYRPFFLCFILAVFRIEGPVSPSDAASPNFCAPCGMLAPDARSMEVHRNTKKHKRLTGEYPRQCLNV